MTRGEELHGIITKRGTSGTGDGKGSGRYTSGGGGGRCFDGGGGGGRCFDGGGGDKAVDELFRYILAKSCFQDAYFLPLPPIVYSFVLLSALFILRTVEFEFAEDLWGRMLMD